MTLSIDKAMDEFCKSYVSYFGHGEETFNAHCFTHLATIYKKCGPIQGCSAYAAEDSYQFLLRCFRAGTAHITKQAMSNYLLKLAFKDHVCKRDLKIRENETARTMDNVIYTDHWKMAIVKTAMEGPEFEVSDFKGSEFEYVCAAKTFRIGEPACNCGIDYLVFDR